MIKVTINHYHLPIIIILIVIFSGCIDVQFGKNIISPHIEREYFVTKTIFTMSHVFNINFNNLSGYYHTDFKEFIIEKNTHFIQIKTVVMYATISPETLEFIVDAVTTYFNITIPIEIEEIINLRYVNLTLISPENEIYQEEYVVSGPYLISIKNPTFGKWTLIVNSVGFGNEMLDRLNYYSSDSYEISCIVTKLVR